MPLPLSLITPRTDIYIPKASCQYAYVCHPTGHPPAFQILTTMLVRITWDPSARLDFEVKGERPVLGASTGSGRSSVTPSGSLEEQNNPCRFAHESHTRDRWFPAGCPARSGSVGHRNMAAGQWPLPL
ncbi:hypothetical protein CMUS01_04174 [Colletotrichum musicola]|uniref:Uncharacterized protein n=1 Tax=Colletotrichum musicola TaxID=2175873 RepID=A0A8H6KXU0_9PEZI|nr:hypothetical protein CMUS01_04174 [Colletotrichum musicola]